jgi:hypothetical protein
MKNLFDPERIAEIRNRIHALPPTATPEWGKMNVTQMMAHCSVGLEGAIGDREIKRVFIGRILGRWVKPFMFRDDEPMKRNAPTAPEFIIKSDNGFDAEQQRLANLVDRFGNGGAAKCTRAPHAFFGPLTPDEWAVLMYKHVDHHLRQFGA